MCSTCTGPGPPLASLEEERATPTRRRSIPSSCKTLACGMHGALAVHVDAKRDHTSHPQGHRTQPSLAGFPSPAAQLFMAVNRPPTWPPPPPPWPINLVTAALRSTTSIKTTNHSAAQQQQKQSRRPQLLRSACHSHRLTADS